MLVVSARAMPEPAPEPESEPEPYAEPEMMAMLNGNPMEMMEMGMNVMKMIMEKCSQAQPILEAISSDGATPELAMQLLTIHQDLEKDFQKLTGMPIPMAMFGEAGLENMKTKEMMMQKGMEAFKTMMSKFSEKKKILDAINTDGATPELAMQLLTATQDCFKTFMDITGLPTPMMKEKMTKMMEKMKKMKPMKKLAMKGMNKAMEVARMTMEKIEEAKDVMRIMASDGNTPELALQLLTIKEDFSTRFTEMTGMPCPLTMMGEQGLENIKHMGMMLMHAEKGVNVAKMISTKTMEEQKALRAINKDGLNAERALALLTIKEDMSTQFKEMTGLPCPMTMMGEHGLKNIKQTERAVMHMEKGTDVADMMTGKMGEMKMVMETINKDGATPDRAMQLMTLSKEMGESFMNMTGLPSPMMLMGHNGIENTSPAA